MHAEISNADAPLVDPRPVMVLANPATWYRQDLRFALKCWNQNLLRADLTPSQRSLAWLIGQDTLARGFYFCIYDALEDLVCEARGVEPVFGISRGNLTEALCGFATSAERKASARRAAGLEGFGLVGVQWMHLEGRMRWALTVLPDAAQWSCGLVPLARLRSRAMVLDGQLKSFAPHLAGEGFAPEPTLKDALAATSFEAPADAPKVDRTDERPFGHRRADASLTKADAPAATVFAGRRANAACGSESRNADSPIKTRCVPKVGTSCARAASSSVTKSSISALTLSVEQLKDLIRSGTEKDFVKAMQSIIPTHENGDGGKWRAKWRVAKLKPFVVAMFEAIIERIAEGTLRRTAALEAHWYWQDYGGAAAEENLRNLLITQ